MKTIFAAVMMLLGMAGLAQAGEAQTPPAPQAGATLPQIDPENVLVLQLFFTLTQQDLTAAVDSLLPEAQLVESVIT